MAPAPALMGTALLLSHLLTRALAERPSATSDAPAWFEAVAHLVRSKLQVRRLAYGVCRLSRGRGLLLAIGCSCLLELLAQAQLGLLGGDMVARCSLLLRAGGGGFSAQGLAAGSCRSAVCSVGQRQPNC